MKFKVLALFVSLAMSMAASAQEVPATQNSTPAPKAGACCHHNMSDMEDAKNCCHHAAESKGAMQCCSKEKGSAKDGESCCEGKDMKASMKQCKKENCCKDAQCVSDSKGDKAAMQCCGDKCQHHKAPAVS